MPNKPWSQNRTLKPVVEYENWKYFYEHDCIISVIPNLYLVIMTTISGIRVQDLIIMIAIIAVSARHVLNKK